MPEEATTAVEEVVTEETPSEEVQPCIINLGTVDNNILIQDQNYEFYYQRVKDPNNNKTPFFEVFYRTDGQPWAIVNGLLTEKYSIAKTEDIITQITKSLKSELVGSKHYRDKTSVKTNFMLKDYALNIDTFSEVDRILFNLMTTIDLAEIQSRTALAFSIVNGFSGNHSLTLSYGLITTLYGEHPERENDMATLAVTNTFVLDEFTHTLIHDDNLDISYTEISNVREQVENKIQEFKDTPVSIEFIESLSKALPKKFIKAFLHIYDQLTDDFKNMYYASFIWSQLLEKSKDLHRELLLRKLVSAYIAKQKLAQAKAEDGA